MKTLDDIKLEVAKNKGFETWEQVMKWGRRLSITQLDSVYDEVARKFADDNSKISNVWGKELDRKTIEEFGFKFDSSEDGKMFFVRDIYGLWYHPNNYLLEIESEEQGEVFNGRIKTQIEFAAAMEEMFH